MKKIILLLAVSLSLSAISDAQYSVLLNFNGTNGANPEGGHLTLAGRKLYGITQGGGLYGGGCIFSIDTNGSNYQKLYDFIFVTGPNPSFVISGKTLYGETGLEGRYNAGYIFAIDTDGNSFRDLFDFYVDSLGIGGYGSLTLIDSKLYGMTFGGRYSEGCIFSIDTTGNNYKDLYNFDGTTGFQPLGDVIFYGGKLYGMTTQGGTHDDGCIFAIDTNGNGYKKLLDFDSINGKYPYVDITPFKGILYGMTSQGGANGDGCIFSIDTTGNSYKKILDFNGINGSYSKGTLVYLNGKLYSGTGGKDSGLIFSIDTSGNEYKDMFDFNGTNGYAPVGSLLNSGNALYGMTFGGGSNNDGVIFKIDTSAIAGIGSIQVNNEMLKVYPNPSNGTFTIQSSVSNGQLLVEIYNVLGEKVYSQLAMDNLQWAINLTSQPNGVYLYRVLAQSGDLVGEGKILIQK